MDKEVSDFIKLGLTSFLFLAVLFLHGFLLFSNYILYKIEKRYRSNHVTKKRYYCQKVMTNIPIRILKYGASPYNLYKNNFK